MRSEDNLSCRLLTDSGGWNHRCGGEYCHFSGMGSRTNGSIYGSYLTYLIDLAASCPFPIFKAMAWEFVGGIWMSILEQIQLVLDLVCLTWNIYFNSVLLQLQNLWYIYLYRYIFHKYIYIYIHIFAYLRTYTYTHTRKLWIIYLYFFISTISLWYKTYFYACFKTPQTYHVWFFNSLRRGDFLMYAGIRLDVGAPDVKTAATQGPKTGNHFGWWIGGFTKPASTITTVVEAFTKKQWSSLFPGPCMPFVENIDFQSVSLGPGLKKNVSSMRFGDASEIKQLWSTDWYQLGVLMMHHSHVTSTSTRLGFFQVWKRRANSRKKPWDIFVYVEC